MYGIHFSWKTSGKDLAQILTENLQMVAKEETDTNGKSIIDPITYSSRTLISMMNGGFYHISYAKVTM